jgi:hypothetical protein
MVSTIDVPFNHSIEHHFFYYMLSFLKGGCFSQFSLLFWCLTADATRRAPAGKPSKNMETGCGWLGVAMENQQSI